MDTENNININSSNIYKGDFFKKINAMVNGDDLTLSLIEQVYYNMNSSGDEVYLFNILGSTHAKKTGNFTINTGMKAVLPDVLPAIIGSINLGATRTNYLATGNASLYTNSNLTLANNKAYTFVFSDVIQAAWRVLSNPEYATFREQNPMLQSALTSGSTQFAKLLAYGFGEVIANGKLVPPILPLVKTLDKLLGAIDVSKALQVSNRLINGLDDISYAVNPTTVNITVTNSTTISGTISSVTTDTSTINISYQYISVNMYIAYFVNPQLASTAITNYNDMVHASGSSAHVFCLLNKSLVVSGFEALAWAMGNMGGNVAAAGTNTNNPIYTGHDAFNAYGLKNGIYNDGTHGARRYITFVVMDGVETFDINCSGTPNITFNNWQHSTLTEKSIIASLVDSYISSTFTSNAANRYQLWLLIQWVAGSAIHDVVYHTAMLHFRRYSAFSSNMQANFNMSKKTKEIVNNNIKSNYLNDIDKCKRNHNVEKTDINYKKKNKMIELSQKNSNNDNSDANDESYVDVTVGKTKVGFKINSLLSDNISFKNDKNEDVDISYNKIKLSNDETITITNSCNDTELKISQDVPVYTKTVKLDGKDSYLTQYIDFWNVDNVAFTTGSTMQCGLDNMLVDTLYNSVSGTLYAAGPNSTLPYDEGHCILWGLHKNMQPTVPFIKIDNLRQLLWCIALLQQNKIADLEIKNNKVINYAASGSVLEAKELFNYQDKLYPFDLFKKNFIMISSYTFAIVLWNINGVTGGDNAVYYFYRPNSKLIYARRDQTYFSSNKNPQTKIRTKLVLGNTLVTTYNDSVDRFPWMLVGNSAVNLFNYPDLLSNDYFLLNSGYSFFPYVGSSNSPALGTTVNLFESFDYSNPGPVRRTIYGTSMELVRLGAWSITKHITVDDYVADLSDVGSINVDDSIKSDYAIIGLDTRSK